MLMTHHALAETRAWVEQPGPHLEGEVAHLEVTGQQPQPETPAHDEQQADRPGHGGGVPEDTVELVPGRPDQGAGQRRVVLSAHDEVGDHEQPAQRERGGQDAAARPGQGVGHPSSYAAVRGAEARAQGDQDQ